MNVRSCLSLGIGQVSWVMDERTLWASSRTGEEADLCF